METDDYGNLTDKIDYKEDLYQIDCNNTVVPFGLIKIKENKTKYNIQPNIFEAFVNLNRKSIILQGIIIRWVGFSVIFQLSNDLQRKVIPDVSGGGK